MKNRITNTKDYVWPGINGEIRGSAIEPLYPGLVKSLSEAQFYKMMALIDAIWVGRARESKLAKQELEKMISYEPSPKSDEDKGHQLLARITLTQRFVPLMTWMYTLLDEKLRYERNGNDCRIDTGELAVIKWVYVLTIY